VTAIRRAGQARNTRLPGVLGHRTFLWLLAGVTFSRVGDAMTFIVVSWLALRAGGPRAVGLVAFAGGCAGPVTAPVIGYLIDRLGLRLLMMADNVARGCLMAGLAVAGATGTLGAAGFPLGSAVGGLMIAAVGTRLTAAAMALGYLPLALAVLPVRSALESLGRRAGTDQVPVAVGSLDAPDRRPVL
jgi:MFS family permease